MPLTLRAPKAGVLPDGFFSALRKVSEGPAPVERGRHSPAYVDAVLSASTALKEEDARAFVRRFLDVGPAFSGTEAGMAAMLFEVWLSEQEGGIYKQFVETQIDPGRPEFLAVFQGPLAKDAVERLTEGVSDFVSVSVVLAAGDRAGGAVSDVTVMEGKPVRGAARRMAKDLEQGDIDTVSIDAPQQVQWSGETREWYEQACKGVEDRYFRRYMPDAPLPESGRITEWRDANSVRWFCLDGVWKPQIDEEYVNYTPTARRGRFVDYNPMPARSNRTGWARSKALRRTHTLRTPSLQRDRNALASRFRRTRREFPRASLRMSRTRPLMGDSVGHGVVVETFAGVQPTPQALASELRLSATEANRIAVGLADARDASAVEKVLGEVASLTGGELGVLVDVDVEGFVGPGGDWGDVALAYVNSGDDAAVTLAYDTVDERFFLTSVDAWLDWAMAEYGEVEEAAKSLPPYDRLALLPYVVAEKVVEQDPDLTAEQKKDFAETVDKMCRRSHEAKAEWWVKIIRSKSNAGRDKLYAWVRHWLGSYKEDPARFKKHMLEGVVESSWGANQVVTLRIPREIDNDEVIDHWDLEDDVMKAVRTGQLVVPDGTHSRRYSDGWNLDYLFDDPADAKRFREQVGKVDAVKDAVAKGLLIESVGEARMVRGDDGTGRPRKLAGEYDYRLIIKGAGAEDQIDFACGRRELGKTVEGTLQRYAEEHGDGPYDVAVKQFVGGAQRWMDMSTAAHLRGAKLPDGMTLNSRLVAEAEVAGKLRSLLSDYASSAAQNLEAAGYAVQRKNDWWFTFTPPGKQADLKNPHRARSDVLRIISLKALKPNDYIEQDDKVFASDGIEALIGPEKTVKVIVKGNRVHFIGADGAVGEGSDDPGFGAVPRSFEPEGESMDADALMDWLDAEFPPYFQIKNRLDCTLKDAQRIVAIHTHATGPGGKGRAWAVAQLRKEGLAESYEPGKPRKIKSGMPSTCRVCGKPIQLGAKIEVDPKRAAGKKCAHLKCIEGLGEGCYEAVIVGDPLSVPAFRYKLLCASEAEARKVKRDLTGLVGLSDVTYYGLNVGVTVSMGKTESACRQFLRDRMQELGLGESVSVTVDEVLSVPEQHQKRIAIRTLGMNDVMARAMGGMSKEEARKFLRDRCGYSDAQIAKLEKSGAPTDESAIAVGDRVAYSKAFLQSTGQYTGKIPHARGVVKEITPLGKTLSLATIDWGDEDVPPRVNVRNLVKIKGGVVPDESTGGCDEAMIVGDSVPVVGFRYKLRCESEAEAQKVKQELSRLADVSDVVRYGLDVGVTVNMGKYESTCRRYLIDRLRELGLGESVSLIRDEAQQPDFAGARDYARSIRNPDKRAYAEAYIQWAKDGYKGDDPSRGGLSVMGAQAVRLQLADYGIREPSDEARGDPPSAPKGATEEDEHWLHKARAKRVLPPRGDGTDWWQWVKECAHAAAIYRLGGELQSAKVLDDYIEQMIRAAKHDGMGGDDLARMERQGREKARTDYGSGRYESDEAGQPDLAGARAYARSLCNSYTRAYAEACIQWAEDGYKGDIPPRAELSLMDAQAVWMQLVKCGVREPTTVLEDALQPILQALDDLGEGVKRVRKSRKGDGHWVTTKKSRQHIYIENGQITKGNKHLLAAIKARTKDKDAPFRVRKGDTVSWTSATGKKVRGVVTKAPAPGQLPDYSHGQQIHVRHKDGSTSVHFAKKGTTTIESIAEGVKFTAAQEVDDEDKEANRIVSAVADALKAHDVNVRFSPYRYGRQSIWELYIPGSRKVFARVTRERASAYTQAFGTITSKIPVPDGRWEVPSSDPKAAAEFIAGLYRAVTRGEGESSEGESGEGHRPFVQAQGSIRSQYGTWKVSADGDQSLLVVGDKTYKAQQPLSEFVELAEGLAGVYGEGCEAEFDLYTEKALQEWAESNAEAIDTVSIGGEEGSNGRGGGEFRATDARKNAAVRRLALSPLLVEAELSFTEPRPRKRRGLLRQAKGMAEGEPNDYVPTNLNTPSALKFKSIVRRILGGDTYNSPELDALAVKEWASDADMRRAAIAFCERRTRRVGFGQLDPLGEDDFILEVRQGPRKPMKAGPVLTGTVNGKDVWIVTRAGTHEPLEVPDVRTGEPMVYVVTPHDIYGDRRLVPKKDLVVGKVARVSAADEDEFVDEAAKVYREEVGEWSIEFDPERKGGGRLVLHGPDDPYDYEFPFSVKDGLSGYEKDRFPSDVDAVVQRVMRRAEANINRRAASRTRYGVLRDLGLRRTPGGWESIEEAGGQSVPFKDRKWVKVVGSDTQKTYPDKRVEDKGGRFHFEPDHSAEPTTRRMPPMFLEDHGDGTYSSWSGGMMGAMGNRGKLKPGVEVTDKLTAADRRDLERHCALLDRGGRAGNALATAALLGRSRRSSGESIEEAAADRERRAEANRVTARQVWRESSGRRLGGRDVALRLLTAGTITTADPVLDSVVGTVLGDWTRVESIEEAELPAELRKDMEPVHVALDKMVAAHKALKALQGARPPGTDLDDTPEYEASREAEFALADALHAVNSKWNMLWAAPSSYDPFLDADDPRAALDDYVVDRWRRQRQEVRAGEIGPAFRTKHADEVKWMQTTLNGILAVQNPSELTVGAWVYVKSSYLDVSGVARVARVSLRKVTVRDPDTGKTDTVTFRPPGKKDNYTSMFSSTTLRKLSPAQAKRMAKLEKLWTDALGESIAERSLWSGDVQTKWSPPEGLFTKSGAEIARVLLKASGTRKQAMARLMFYVNRAGKGVANKDELDRAREIIGKADERLEDWGGIRMDYAPSPADVIDMLDQSQGASLRAVIDPKDPKRVFWCDAWDATHQALAAKVGIALRVSENPKYSFYLSKDKGTGQINYPSPRLFKGAHSNPHIAAVVKLADAHNAALPVAIPVESIDTVSIGEGVVQDFKPGDVVRLKGKKRRYVVGSVNTYRPDYQDMRLYALSGAQAGCGPSGLSDKDVDKDGDQGLAFSGKMAAWLKGKFVNDMLMNQAYQKWVADKPNEYQTAHYDPNQAKAIPILADEDSADVLAESATPAVMWGSLKNLLATKKYQCVFMGTFGRFPTFALCDNPQHGSAQVMTLEQYREGLKAGTCVEDDVIDAPEYDIPAFVKACDKGIDYVGLPNLPGSAVVFVPGDTGHSGASGWVYLGSEGTKAIIHLPREPSSVALDKYKQYKGPRSPHSVVHEYGHKAWLTLPASSQKAAIDYYSKFFIPNPAKAEQEKICARKETAHNPNEWFCDTVGYMMYGDGKRIRQETCDFIRGLLKGKAELPSDAPAQLPPDVDAEEPKITVKATDDPVTALTNAGLLAAAKPTFDEPEFWQAVYPAKGKADKAWRDKVRKVLLMTGALTNGSRSGSGSPSLYTRKDVLYYVNHPQGFAVGKASTTPVMVKVSEALSSDVSPPQHVSFDADEIGNAGEIAVRNLREGAWLEELCEAGFDMLAQIKWEEGLKAGDKVLVRWTAGSAGHYMSPATIQKVNQSSVTVTLDQPVETGQWGTYPAGRKINVPLCSSCMRTSNSKWSQINGVFPSDAGPYESALGEMGAEFDVMIRAGRSQQRLVARLTPLVGRLRQEGASIAVEDDDRIRINGISPKLTDDLSAALRGVADVTSGGDGVVLTFSQGRVRDLVRDCLSESKQTAEFLRLTAKLDPRRKEEVWSYLIQRDSGVSKEFILRARPSLGPWLFASKLGDDIEKLVGMNEEDRRRLRDTEGDPIVKDRRYYVAGSVSGWVTDLHGVGDLEHGMANKLSDAPAFSGRVVLRNARQLLAMGNAIVLDLAEMRLSEAEDFAARARRELPPLKLSAEQRQEPSGAMIRYEVFRLMGQRAELPIAPSAALIAVKHALPGATVDQVRDVLKDARENGDMRVGNNRRVPGETFWQAAMDAKDFVKSLLSEQHYGDSRLTLRFPNWRKASQFLAALPSKVEFDRGADDTIVRLHHLSPDLVKSMTALADEYGGKVQPVSEAHARFLEAKGSPKVKAHAQAYLDQMVNYGGQQMRLGDVIADLQKMAKKQGLPASVVDRYVQGLLYSEERAGAMRESAPSREEIINGGKRVATDPMMGGVYIDYKDVTWLLSGSRGMVNMGPTAEFTQKVKDGKLRAKLVESAVAVDRFIALRAEEARSSDASDRNKVNRALSDMTRNKFFPKLPLAEVDAVLKQHGFDEWDSEGIYTGEDGRLNDPVGRNTWLALTWHKMPSGNYEIVAYVSGGGRRNESTLAEAGKSAHKLPQELWDKAKAMGERAFHAGRPAVPAQDPDFSKLLKGLKAGEAVELLDAWHRGWSQANVDAPVTEAAGQDGLMAALKEKPKGEHQLSDLARHPALRGVHFKAIQSAAKALAKRGVVKYDGVSVIQLAEGSGVEEAWTTHSVEQAVGGAPVYAKNRIIRVEPVTGRNVNAGTYRVTIKWTGGTTKDDETFSGSAKAVAEWVNKTMGLSESLTAGQLSESLVAAATKTQSPVPSPQAAKEPLSRRYIQWVQQGNDYHPAGAIQLEGVLGRHAYQLSLGMSGPVFTRVQPQTDELFRFPNSAMEEVIQEIDKFWGLKDDYESLGLMHNRGILMYGPPGNGKSAMIQQVVEQICGRGDVVFFANSISAVRECLRAFREVEPDRKVVVVLEDADEYVGYSERDFLQLLDGTDRIQGVLYLATSNYIDRFPPRLLRPGRFDKKVYIPPPNEDGRLMYLQRKLKGHKVDERTLRRFAKATDGMSFGHLREFITGAYALGEDPDSVIARLKAAPIRESQGDSGNDTVSIEEERQDAVEFAIRILKGLKAGIRDSHDPLRRMLVEWFGQQPKVPTPRIEQSIVDVALAIRSVDKLAPEALPAPVAEALQYASGSQDPLKGLQNVLTVEFLQSDYAYQRNKSVSGMPYRAQAILKEVGKLPAGFSMAKLLKDAAVEKDGWRRTPDDPKFGEATGEGRADDVVVEVSPPGFSGTIRAMTDKHGMDKRRAFALAWAMYKRGARPRKKPEKAPHGIRHYITPRQYALRRRRLADAAGLGAGDAVLLTLVDEVELV